MWVWLVALLLVVIVRGESTIIRFHYSRGLMIEFFIFYFFFFFGIFIIDLLNWGCGFSALRLECV